MRTFKPLLFTAALASALFISGCEEETDPIDTLEVPSTYAFTRDGISTVDHAGQTERLDQLAIMTTLMKTGNTLGNAAINGQLLKDMFANTGNPYTGVTFTKDLRSKCFSNDVDTFEVWMDQLAAASSAQVVASNGVAGVLVEGNTDPTTGYLVDANGVELTQVIEKGLMGAVFYFQAMEIYLSEERMAELGNDDFVEGENYTAMEHYFDEAFGYFGAPIDFPSATSIDQARYWAKYAQARNNGLYPGISEEMATAFRTGRAAITAKDYEARDEAIQTIQEKWAIVAAGTAVDYLTKGLSTSGSAVYSRHHALSEAAAFTLCLKYHFVDGNSKYPPLQSFASVQQALDLVGPSTNFYTLTDADINAAIVKIKEAFPAGVIK
jgi:hypothetical protein